MTGQYMSFREIPRFTKEGDYSVDVAWTSLEETLADYVENNGLLMDPDFQRGHVWTEMQQIRYVEFVLRGGRSSRVIHFNQSGWLGHGRRRGEPMVLIDGKQRIEAVRSFMGGRIKAFGSYVHEFSDRPDRTQCRFTFNVNALETEREVLQWYLDLNSGGVVHSNDELDRVRALLEAAE